MRVVSVLLCRVRQPAGYCRDYVLRAHTASSYGFTAQTRSARFYKTSDEMHSLKMLNIVVNKIHYPEKLSDEDLMASSIISCHKNKSRTGSVTYKISSKSGNLVLCKMNRRKSNRYASGRTASSKALLLPPTAESVRALSLRHHLALAALKVGSGNGPLLTELIRAVYVTWYLQEAGFGAIDPNHYVEAEQALARCGVRAAAENVWQLNHADTPVLERVLALHDWQLQRTPISAMRDVQKRLTRFVQGNRASPWQGIVKE